MGIAPGLMHQKSKGQKVAPRKAADMKMNNHKAKLKTDVVRPMSAQKPSPARQQFFTFVPKSPPAVSREAFGVDWNRTFNSTPGHPSFSVSPISSPPPTPGRDNRENWSLEYLQKAAMSDAHNIKFYKPGESRSRPLTAHLVRRNKANQAFLHDFYFSMAGVPGFDADKYGLEQCLAVRDKVCLPNTPEGKAHGALFTAVARVAGVAKEVEAAQKDRNDSKVAQLMTDSLEEMNNKNRMLCRDFLNEWFYLNAAIRFVDDIIFQQEMKRHILAVRIELNYTTAPLGYNWSTHRKMAPKYHAILQKMKPQQNAEDAEHAATTRAELGSPDTDGSIQLTKPVLDFIQQHIDLAKEAHDVAKGAQAALVQISKDSTAQHTSRDTTSKEQAKAMAAAQVSIQQACATASMAIAASAPHLTHMMPANVQGATTASANVAPENPSNQSNASPFVISANVQGASTTDSMVNVANQHNAGPADNPPALHPSAPYCDVPPLLDDDDDDL
jgi:hypothetical protein